MVGKLVCVCLYYLLRAKRASNVQEAYFVFERKKMFLLWCRLKRNFIEGDPISQWLPWLQSCSPVVPTNKEDERSPVIRGETVVASNGAKSAARAQPMSALPGFILLLPVLLQ